MVYMGNMMERRLQDSEFKVRIALEAHSRYGESDNGFEVRTEPEKKLLSVRTVLKVQGRSCTHWLGKVESS